jgi:predicted HicB family RNase H-like nuclease
MVRAPSPAQEIAPEYRVSVTRASENGDDVWLAEVDGFPECTARAATPAEAVQRAWAAASGDTASKADDGRESRSSSPRSGKLLLRMPATLHDELAREAENEGVSLNQLITGVLAGAVDWRAREGSGAAAGNPRTARLMSIALIINLAVVAVAAVAAVVLLVAAWQHGW